MNRVVAKIITGVVLVGTIFMGAMIAPKEVRADDSEYIRVKGISVSQTSVTFKDEGDTITIEATVMPTNANNSYIHWCSSDPSVAGVDNGYIRAFADGTATITATTDEGGYSAYITVTVGSGKATVNSATATNVQATTDVIFDKVNNEAVAKIINAKKNGTVTIISATPASFDTNVALAMATRPDVKVECVFQYSGYNYKLTIPRGYNLSRTMNGQGYISWLDLCKYNGIGGITSQMLN